MHLTQSLPIPRHRQGSSPARLQQRQGRHQGVTTDCMGNEAGVHERRLGFAEARKVCDTDSSGSLQEMWLVMFMSCLFIAF